MRFNFLNKHFYTSAELICTTAAPGNAKWARCLDWPEQIAIWRNQDKINPVFYNFHDGDSIRENQRKFSISQVYEKSAAIFSKLTKTAWRDILRAVLTA